MLRGDRHMDVDQLARVCAALDLRVTDVFSEAERALSERMHELAVLAAERVAESSGEPPGEGGEGRVIA